MKITKPINLFALTLLGLSTACGGGEKTSEAASVPTEAVAQVSASPPAEKAPEPATQVESDYSPEEIVEVGFMKMEGSDCSSCHAKEEKIIGPPLIDIAMEYENNAQNINKLAAKVIEGGSGVWGDYAMPPHAGLSLKDAKAMVAYILQLK